VRPDFDGWVKSVLADTELPAEYLEIELTESVAFGNPAIVPALEALRQIGVRFATDDFGTGYSCLQHLKCCPITTLKIDQSFVARLPDDTRNQSIVRAVIQLAHGLGMEVVAEGVETPASLAWLRQASCDTVQGFLFAKPMPAAAFVGFVNQRFLGALMVSNFVVVPLLVALLVQFLPPDPMVRLGVLFVLLTPCIDYVVTFSHIGRADARLLLASTPALLIAQMLLPVYLGVFLGDASADLVQLGPFVHAFVWLIAVPLASAAMVQVWAARSKAGARVAAGLGLLPVPATALVLFIVVAAVVPQLGAAIEAALRVLPLYVAFAVVAPLIGWTVARVARLDVPAGRAVAFSSATRNSLVVLPLALAVPGAIPVLPAIIVTQTMVELIGELVYMRLIPKLGKAPSTCS